MKKLLLKRGKESTMISKIVNDLLLKQVEHQEEEVKGVILLILRRGPLI